MLQNDLLVRAARGETTERPPVWLMRQAGRILPEYRAIRNSLSGFKELVETPELASEVTIQPVDILDVDAAIIFSDILVIPEAMGLPYEMIEKKGPSFPRVVRSAAEIDKLGSSGLELNYVYDAIRLTKKKLDGRVPLIGFAGAPWTIMCYMTEGGGSKTFSWPRRMLYSDPGLAEKLLDKITISTIEYLKNQIKAGADVIQLFDSWAGVLSPEQYGDFGLKYIRRILEEVDEVPVTVFAKGAAGSSKDLMELPCRTIGLDWQMNIHEFRAHDPSKTLQGNLDPCVLYADEDTIIQHTRKMMGEFGKSNYIVNLGHGVYPDTDPVKVKLFVDTVKGS